MQIVAVLVMHLPIFLLPFDFCDIWGQVLNVLSDFGCKV